MNFVATDPAHGVTFRAGLAETLGGLSQEAVADGVAEPVVYGLEVVEVDIDEGIPSPGAFAAPSSSRGAGRDQSRFKEDASLSTDAWTSSSRAH